MIRGGGSAVDQSFSSSLDINHARTDYASLILLPRARAFVVSGTGLPSSGDFIYASNVLRDLAFELRQQLARRGIRVRKPNLEISWSAPHASAIDARGFEDRSTWDWQQLTRFPLATTDADAEVAVAEVAKRAGRSSPLAHVKVLESGPAAQMLHIGGWQSQAATLRRLVDNLDAAGIRTVGPVHVVRVADETIVPAARAASIVRLRMDQSLNA